MGRLIHGVKSGGRPKNLRRGYLTRESGIPHPVVKSLERTRFDNPWIDELARLVCGWSQRKSA
jgi:hypothetical protein